MYNCTYCAQHPNTVVVHEECVVLRCCNVCLIWSPPTPLIQYVYVLYVVCVCVCAGPQCHQEFQVPLISHLIWIWSDLIRSSRKCQQWHYSSSSHHFSWLRVLRRASTPLALYALRVSAEREFADFNQQFRSLQCSLLYCVNSSQCRCSFISIPLFMCIASFSSPRP